MLEGDIVREALARDFNMFRARLRAVAWKYVGPDADDVVQDVFVRALTGGEGFRHESAVLTWLYRMTVNACLTDHRRRRRHREHSRTLRTHITVPPVSPDVLALKQALATLESVDRRVCLLYHVMGCTHEEIAATLLIPVGTSKWKLSMAHRRLRETLRSPLPPSRRAALRNQKGAVPAAS